MAFFKPGYKRDVISKCAEENNSVDASSTTKRKRETKGKTIGLSTFLSWGKQCVFGHETIENENKKRLVNFIWCKCAGNMNNLLEGIQI